MKKDLQNFVEQAASRLGARMRYGEREKIIGLAGTFDRHKLLDLLKECGAELSGQKSWWVGCPGSKDYVFGFAFPDGSGVSVHDCGIPYKTDSEAANLEVSESQFLSIFAISNSGEGLMYWNPD